MQVSEHETTINFEYDQRVVRIYTTREGCANGIIRRLGDASEFKQERLNSFSWSFTIPMGDCRSPELIVKLLNPDEKTPMSEAQKAALRGA